MLAKIIAFLTNHHNLLGELLDLVEEMIRGGADERQVAGVIAERMPALRELHHNTIGVLAEMPRASRDELVTQLASNPAFGAPPPFVSPPTSEAFMRTMPVAMNVGATIGQCKAPSCGTVMTTDQVANGVATCPRCGAKSAA